MSPAFQMNDLKGIFVELPPRPSEEPVSSVSLYKQVQGSDLTWTAPPGIPGGMAEPEVSWRVPSWFEGNNRTQGQSVHRRPSARQGVTWILNPEDVQASRILSVITLPGPQLFPRSPDLCRVGSRLVQNLHSSSLCLLSPLVTGIRLYTVESKGSSLPKDNR
ncbi:hypothetical protein LEMLEM_LOCUS26180 [Lemmus lemmus]